MLIEDQVANFKGIKFDSPLKSDLDDLDDVFNSFTLCVSLGELTRRCSAGDADTQDVDILEADKSPAEEAPAEESPPGEATDDDILEAEADKSPAEESPDVVTH